METVGSLPPSQVPTNCPYPQDRLQNKRMVMHKLWFLEKHFFICSYFCLCERPSMCACVIISIVTSFFYFCIFVHIICLKTPLNI